MFISICSSYEKSCPCDKLGSSNIYKLTRAHHESLSNHNLELFCLWKAVILQSEISQSWEDRNPSQPRGNFNFNLLEISSPQTGLCSHISLMQKAPVATIIISMVMLDIGESSLALTKGKSEVESPLCF